MDNLISASNLDFEGLFWLTRGSPRAISARRKPAPANQVPGTKNGPEWGPKRRNFTNKTCVRVHSQEISRSRWGARRF